MKRKRIIAVLMAAVMCLTAVSCSNSEQPPVSEINIGERWQISEEEALQAAQLSCNTAKNGDTLEVTLTCDEDLFGENIEKSNIVVQAFEYQPKEQTNEESVDTLSTDLSEAGAETTSEEQQHEPESSFADPITITDYTLSRTDAKTLTISFKDTYEYGVYDFYIHKDGTSSGKYAGGTYINLPEEESAVQNPVSAFVDGIFYNGDENPVLNVILENTTAADVKPENFELLGAFEDLSITSVTATDTEITLNTVGKVHICSAPYGYVDISPEALSTENEIIATTEILLASAYLPEETFVYENGNLKFDLELSGAEAEKKGYELAGLITVGGDSVASAAANTEGNVITVTVPTKGADIDSAIKSIIEKSVVIREEALSCDTDIEYTITDNSAYLAAYTDYIEKTDSGYKCTLYLVPIYGSLADLTAADLTFDGDFEGAKVTDVKQEGSLCTVTFTFTGEKSLDGSIFEGGVRVADGKIINAWGTPSEYTHEAFGYMPDSVRIDQSTIKEVIDKLAEAKDTFETIRDFAMTFEKLAKSAYSLDYDGFVGASTKILTSLGIIDRAPDKMDMIYSAVMSVKNDIKNLDSKIDSMTANLKQELEYIEAGIDKDLYQNAFKGWSDFCTYYMEPLESRFNSLSNDTRANIINMVKYVKQGDSLSVVYDVNGKLTIADKLDNSYSVENIRIDREITIALDINSFPNASADLNSYARVEAGLEEDIRNLIIAQELAADEESVTKLTKEFMASIASNAMYDALTEDPQTLNNIQNDFSKFCKKLKGEGSATSPLIHRFYNVYATYNFQYEAEEYLTSFNDYLKAFTIQYGAFATLAASYNTGYDKDSNPIANDIKSTIVFLENNVGLHEVQDDRYQWCYVIDRPIKTNAIAFHVPEVRYYATRVDYVGYRFDGWAGNEEPYITYMKIYAHDYSKDGFDYERSSKTLVYKEGTDISDTPRLSSSQLDKIRARYLYMGNDPDKFFDYMTSDKLFETGLWKKDTDYAMWYVDRSLIGDKMYAFTGYQGEQSFDVHDKENLYTTNSYNALSKTTEMFNLNKKYQVPTDKKAKYFTNCRKYIGSVYNLSNGESKSSAALVTTACYGESSIWWSNDNWMEFRNTIYDCQPILPHDQEAAEYAGTIPEFVTYNATYYPPFLEFEIG